MSTRSDLLWWAVALIVVLPLAIVVLGEIAARLRRRGSVYVAPLELARTVAAPAVVGYLIVRRILRFDTEHTASRLALTVLLITLSYVGFVLLRLVSQEKRQDRWENSVPSLFKIILRIAVIAVPIFMTFDAWGIDLSSNLSALGIGGLAIAFALQDAIGNVVSGILLVLDRPFSVGDWIEVDGLHGEVIDISWRSTRIQVDADIVILPNITLSGSSIRNLTAIDPAHEVSMEFTFSSDERPSDVKAMLLEVAADNSEISTQQPPEIFTAQFGNSAVTYQLNYTLDEYHGDREAAKVEDQLRSAVFYARARHGLTGAYPVSIQLSERVRKPVPGLENAPAFLAVNPLFSQLPDDVVNRLAAEMKWRVYTVDDTMLWADRANSEIQIIKSGQAIMRPASLANRPGGGASDGADDGIMLTAGQLIGEESLVSKVAGGWHVKARSDVEVFVLDIDLVRATVEQHTRFASSMNELMNDRSRRLHEIVSNAPVSTRPARNGSDAQVVELRSDVSEQLG